MSHGEKLADGFTKKYNVVKLVYYEALDDPESAIRREKQIKAGSRRKNMELVECVNKDWRDCTKSYEIASLRSQ